MSSKEGRRQERDQETTLPLEDKKHGPPGEIVMLVCCNKSSNAHLNTLKTNKSTSAKVFLNHKPFH